MLWVLCGSVYLRCPQYYNDTPFVSVCNYLANFIIGLKSDRLEKEVITINVNFLKFPLSVSDMTVFELELVLIWSIAFVFIAMISGLTGNVGSGVLGFVD